jgi:methylated-DNA-[protein]-cysteine S-methyltransferase
MESRDRIPVDEGPTSEGIAPFETALGICAIRWTRAGIASVRLPSLRTAALPRADSLDLPEWVHAAIEGIVAVLAGRGANVGGRTSALAGRAVDLRDVPLDETAIEPFRREVYAATRDVLPGSTATYGEIARRIGRTDPQGARDVGAALARNPFPIVVPCHRVLGANGRLTGFSAPGGLETKRRMLELEGAPGYGQQALFG